MTRDKRNARSVTRQAQEFFWKLGFWAQNAVLAVFNASMQGGIGLMQVCNALMQAYNDTMQVCIASMGPCSGPMKVCNASMQT